jgi:hypothetical protein
MPATRAFAALRAEGIVVKLEDGDFMDLHEHLTHWYVISPPSTPDSPFIAIESIPEPPHDLVGRLQLSRGWQRESLKPKGARKTHDTVYSRIPLKDLREWCDTGGWPPALQMYASDPN